MTRYFDDSCELRGGEHQPGDVHWEIGACDQVFTGTDWTRICPNGGEPMTGRDAEGWLCCAACGARFDQVPRREVAP